MKRFDVRQALRSFHCASKPGDSIRDLASAPLRRRSRLLAIVCAHLLSTTQAAAAVFDTAVTDVTTRAFSVVWVSDVPVADATVRAFNDPNGLDEITSALTITAVSAASPMAHDLGIAKVDVTGLAPGQTVYIQTQTVDTSAVTTMFPETAPFLEVSMAGKTTKANALNGPIVNDLVTHDVFAADGSTPADGALLLVEVPGISPYPLTTFVGEGFNTPAAVVDLNNVFDSETDSNAEVPGEEVLRLIEYRGLLCSGLESHKLVRYRRAPEHEEFPRITELEVPTKCFLTDTVCDSTVNILDVQFALNAFASSVGECRFNADVDLVVDSTINILDVQTILNDFGKDVDLH